MTQRLSVALATTAGFLLGGTAGLTLSSYVTPGRNRYERGVDATIIGTAGAALGAAIGAVLATPPPQPAGTLSGANVRFP